MTEVLEVTDETIVHTTAIVAAFVSRNAISTSELPNLIGSVHAALRTLAMPAASAPPEPLAPAVPIRKSVTPDFIVCLDDGKKFKSLKRHLATHFQLTPDEYRAKWGLPSDYPMVAPNYAATRSALAKSNGLGRKPALVAPVKGKGRQKAAAK